ncbi:MAG: histidine kinase [Chitinophagaceae bacterium]
MVSLVRNKKWIVAILITAALIPVVITAGELIATDSKSVVFLGNLHPALAIFIICYYVLLLCLGTAWLIRQVILIARLKAESRKAELMLLKSQVSPHFFFNMLNNLYGLVVKDAPKAQQLILKLSDMMRYSIYNGENETVLLKDEIDFLKNYIELHKTRYHKHITVSFNYTADENRKVVPLLFIILLENAFKHGVENLRENAYVKIDLATSGNSLFFSIENNYEPIESKPGIGLKNLKRRLELTYPKQHDLSFSVTGNVYQAQLVLKQL